MKLQQKNLTTLVQFQIRYHRCDRDNQHKLLKDAMGNSCGIVSRQLSHSKTQQVTDNRFTCNRYIIANDMGYPTVTSLRTTWDIERYLLLHARSVHDVEATAGGR